MSKYKKISYKNIKKSANIQLKSKILFYVKNENLRQKISIAGWRRLLDSNYSLESRLKYIIKKCKQFLF